MKLESIRSHFWTGFNVALEKRLPHGNNEWIWLGWAWGHTEAERLRSVKKLRKKVARRSVP